MSPASYTSPVTWSSTSRLSVISDPEIGDRLDAGEIEGMVGAPGTPRSLTRAMTNRRYAAAGHSTPGRDSERKDRVRCGSVLSVQGPTSVLTTPPCRLLVVNLLRRRLVADTVPPDSGVQELGQGPLNHRLRRRGTLAAQRCCRGAWAAVDARTRLSNGMIFSPLDWVFLCCTDCEGHNMSALPPLSNLTGASCQAW